jgi:hypothetical protein
MSMAFLVSSMSSASRGPPLRLNRAVPRPYPSWKPGQCRLNLTPSEAQEPLHIIEGRVIGHTCGISLPSLSLRVGGNDILAAVELKSL